MAEKKRFKLFDSRIFWAVASLLASLLIWVYMTSTQQEPIEVTLRGVQLVFEGEDTLLQSREYVVTDVDTQTVDLVISGTRLNIGGLSAGDVQAVVDVSRISRAGNWTVVYDLRFPDSVDAEAVTLVSSSPSQVQFIVTRMSTKNVPVVCNFVGNTAEGYIAEDLTYAPSYVVVSGAQSELDKIDHVYAELGGEEVSRTREVELPFVLRDAEGNVLEIEDLEYDTELITVTQSILMQKEVPLEVSLVYGAGATAENTTCTVLPETIIIAGDPAIVEGYNKITLGPVDLTDFAATHSTTLDIRLDNDIRNVTGETRAEVTITIAGLATKTLNVTNLSHTGLPEGFAVEEIITNSLPVEIRGPEDIVGDIVAENVRAIADLSGVTATGDQTVPVQIRVDGFADAGAIGDYTIFVSIRIAG